MGCLEAFLSQHFPCNMYERFKNLDDSIHCYDISLEEHDELNHTTYIQDMRIRHPHLALIGYGDDNPDYARWLCSGSIISDKYILTAAHCMFIPESGEIKFAALGTQQWPTDLRYWQIYKIVKIIVHPEYVPLSKYHDIALLKTAAKIIYNLEVIPACLQRFDYMPGEAIATGWNAIGHHKHPADILNGVPIIQFSHIACMEAFAKNRQLAYGYNSYIQACYGDGDYSNDVCEGDSGGPLQVFTNRRKAKCLHTILGVTSYGRACGHLGTAGLYTRIAAYVPWIESITGYLT
ncbi:hypothetical protein PYW07_013100 [Mythimna separata]|uniref:Peptidase S1 domain-containing protein n=1 Tax=Mythimna separata TaxID=271217 RepID=A0AAD7Y5R8_MYTSE|nr:hypothetical protein PYW07_013100 [Mythimna separata]